MIGVALAAHVAAGAPVFAEGDVERGAYVYRAANCVGCHTTPSDMKKGVHLAGGRDLKTPFGIYHSPNITPDPDTGIGRWSLDDFRRAIREGKSPAGEHYFPVFPYTSYTGMTDADIDDLWAYMRTLPAVKRENRPHQAGIFGIRLAMWPWKLLNFTEGPRSPDAGQSAEWNRGAYLVNVLGHCGECHTPRNLMGGLKLDQSMAGNPEGPEGDPVPNITPHSGTGVGEWSVDDMDTLLSMGMLPDGDFVGSAMTEVVESTSKWTAEDRKAVAVYLKSLPPIQSKAKKNK